MLKCRFLNCPRPQIFRMFWNWIQKPPSWTQQMAQVLWFKHAFSKFSYTLCYPLSLYLLLKMSEMDLLQWKTNKQRHRGFNWSSRQCTEITAISNKFWVQNDNSFTWLIWLIANQWFITSSGRKARTQQIRNFWYVFSNSILLPLFYFLSFLPHPTLSTSPSDAQVCLINVSINGHFTNIKLFWKNYFIHAISSMTYVCIYKSILKISWK